MYIGELNILELARLGYNPMQLIALISAIHNIPIKAASTSTFARHFPYTKVELIKWILRYELQFAGYRVDQTQCAYL